MEELTAILDGGPTKIGVESTVLDLTVNPPMLLRPGGTTLEDLKKVAGEVRLHPFVETENELAVAEARSPGMKHKHYAPKAEVILVEGAIPAVRAKVKELAESYQRNGVRVGILATDETQTAYQANVVASLGSRFNLAMVAHSLFRLLRQIDAQNVDVIIVEAVPSEGLGLAVMNRLRKASGYHIIKAT